MANTTGRIPLYIIGTVTGILVIGLLGIFFYNFKANREIFLLGLPFV